MDQYNILNITNSIVESVADASNIKPPFALSDCIDYIKRQADARGLSKPLLNAIFNDEILFKSFSKSFKPQVANVGMELNILGDTVKRVIDRAEKAEHDKNESLAKAFEQLDKMYDKKQAQVKPMQPTPAPMVLQSMSPALNTTTSIPPQSTPELIPVETPLKEQSLASTIQSITESIPVAIPPTAGPLTLQAVQEPQKESGQPPPEPTATTAANPMLDAALEYAIAGFKVLPCSPNSKEPLFVLVPHGYLNATDDPEVIIDWWTRYPNANLALAMIDHVAVDKDTHNADANGFDNFKKLQGNNELPLCPTQQTPGGIAGGEHLIFVLPLEDDEMSFQAKVLNSDGKETGIEVKHKGYIMAAPSVVNGKAYKWIASPIDVRPPQMPFWLFEILVKKDTFKSFENAKGGGKRVDIIDDSPDRQKLAIKMIKNLGIIQEGSRNNAVLLASRRMWDMGLSISLMTPLISEHMDMRPQMEDKEIEKRVLSSIKGCKNPQGCKHPDAGGKKDLPPELSNWGSVTIPKGYVLDSTSLSHWKAPTRQNDLPHLERICDPIIAVANLRPASSTDVSSLVLEFRSMDMNVKELIIKRTELHDKNDHVIQELARQHFRVEVDKPKELLKYLGKFNPKTVFTVVGKTGWIINNDKLDFVLPCSSTSPEYIMQIDGNPLLASIRSKGTLDDYIINVWNLIKDNPIARYEIFKAFVPPLLIFLYAIDVGAENICGLTTIGKTILLQILASVWGNAMHPSNSKGIGFIKTFSTTKNALAALKDARNDLPCPIDEVGLADTKDFYRLVYEAAASEEKLRLNRSIEMQRSRTFLTQITSTGEVTIQQMIEEEQRRAKGGQLVRFNDRHFKNSPFKNKQEADAVRAACGKYSGALGPIVVDRWRQKYTATSFTEIVNKLAEEAKDRILTLHPRLSNLQQRGIGNNAAAEAAGLLLVETGVLPGLTELHVRESVNAVVGKWLEDSGEMDDQSRWVTRIRQYLLTYQDREFPEYEQRERWDKNCMDYKAFINKVYYGRSGFTDMPNQCFYIFPHKLAEITQADQKVVATVLKERGFLITDSRGNYKRIRFGGPTQPDVYAVKFSILERPLTWEDVI